MKRLFTALEGKLASLVAEGACLVCNPSPNLTDLGLSDGTTQHRFRSFPSVRYAVMRDDLPSSPSKEFLTQQKSMERISNSELEITLEK
jgi:hypothetical protein